MKERPIAFTDGLVDLVVDGSKTHTRRALGRKFVGDRWRLEKLEGPVAHMRHPEHGLHRVRCPYGAPGDTLWIRQGWKTPESWDHLSPTDLVETWSDAAPIMLTSNGRRFGNWLPLQADALADSTPGRVRAPMHLPHALAAHRVTVASIRVEPVTSISEADAKAEGVAPFRTAGPDQRAMPAFPWEVSHGTHPHVIAFASLWDSINSARGLGVVANPWVWVVEMSNPRTR